AIVYGLGGKLESRGEVLVADFPFAGIFEAIGVVSLLAWLGGAAWLSRRRGLSYWSALVLWGRWGWLWWLLPIAGDASGMAISRGDWPSRQALWLRSLPLCHSTLWAGWLTSFFALSRGKTPEQHEPAPPLRTPAAVWTAAAVYFVCF